MANKKTRQKKTVRRRQRKRHRTVRRKYFGGATYQCVNTWTIGGYAITIRHREGDNFKQEKQDYDLQIYDEVLTLPQTSPIFVDIKITTDQNTLYYIIIQLTSYSVESTTHKYIGKLKYISFIGKDNQFMEVKSSDQKAITMTSTGPLKCFTMDSDGNDPYKDNEILTQMNRAEHQQQGMMRTDENLEAMTGQYRAFDKTAQMQVGQNLVGDAINLLSKDKYTHTYATSEYAQIIQQLTQSMGTTIQVTTCG